MLLMIDDAGLFCEEAKLVGSSAKNGSRLDRRLEMGNGTDLNGSGSWPNRSLNLGRVMAELWREMTPKAFKCLN